MTTANNTNDYKEKQTVARKIEDYANTERWNNHSYFPIAFDELGKLITIISKLDCFAAKVAETIDKTMDPYGFKVANVSSKQAWILACAAVENNIAF